jgi:hypothetical protein
MANKKRRRPRNRPSAGGAGPQAAQTAPSRGGANADRRERKQQAREARERARKQQARRRSVRRGVSLLAVGAIAFVAVLALNRAASPGSLSPEVQELASSLGCTEVRTPANNPPANQHLDPGQDANYTERPATSGFHDLSTLGTDTKVFDQPVREERAVHTLEHGGVLLYYRADGPGAVDQDVIEGLASIAEQRKAVFVAPYPDFEDGTSLAMTAWNTVMTCPGDVDGEDAVTIAEDFAQSFECTSRAPESGVSAECA